MVTMATMLMLGILLIGVISRCHSESTNGYHNNGNVASQIGDLLKPPPLPPLSPLVPVPFHGGAGRIQRLNADIGYQYQPLSPPLPSPPLAPSTDFKFPAPFYKQYNFNFVPPPQPFSTTPSPSIFQKVSGWLFPSKEVSYEAGLSTNSITPLKKDCNPCNLVPWIPVLRYKIGSEKEQQNISPTYGSPSPTAYTSLQNIGQYQPQYLNTNNYDQRHQSLPGGVPHEVYGPPKQSKPHTNLVGSLSSTYGPPSATYTVPILQNNPISSTLTLSSNSYNPPSTSYGTPSIPIGTPSSSYGLPLLFNTLSSSTSRTPTPSYVSPPYDNNRFLSTTYSPISLNYYPEVLNKDLPSQSNVEILDEIKPATELELPKVTSPTGFKNSYGEIITNTYALDIPYSVSATAAESNKIKTEVLPYDGINLVTPNISVALANPAPFTLNRGRNIHTLQPVALPNLSVSPLPPIFNARPFRPVSHNFPTNASPGIIQHPINNVKVEKSVPISEFTHSIEYPTTIIQSPIIEIDATKLSNQTKAYRNIPNSFVIDVARDITSQASEDHISAAKSQPDSSFESTGADFGNDLYESGLPIGLNINSLFPSNHKPDFADLRGLKDEDVDKYRTESNLQNIDSPLLYLKPSAPHKDFENFVTVSTPVNGNEYEMYDDIPTTTLSPQHSTQFTSAWDESRTHFSNLSPPIQEQDQTNHGKVIQIIVPYTTGQKNYVESWPKTWEINSEKNFLARKVQSNTENYSFTTSTTTESYNMEAATGDQSQATVTEHTEADQQNTPAILNDLYDVKEPPFDIIKLQHTIDDWTEQEYSNSKYIRTPQRTRSSEKYAKQIPDDYFTTTMSPLGYVTSANNYNYDFYDHEVSSSVQHTITENKNSTITKPQKEYNSLERTKSEYNSGKNEEPDEIRKLHIYTAASSFRTSTATPAPWSEIQTSISPLTKEKVYVVTSKPWREKPKAPEFDYDVGAFESKKTGSDSTGSKSDDLPFKSPRFSHRPSFGFQTTGVQNQLHLDESPSSKEWHHSINDLRTLTQSEHLFLFEGSDQKDNINVEEETATPKTVA